MSIALRHITLAYGRRILLRNVSASVPPGSLTALIGRNGTGCLLYTSDAADD